MRIKITLSKANFTIPLSYQSLLQSAIYNLLNQQDLNNYSYQNRRFKGFVFSNLFGKYQVVEGLLHYQDEFYFYISSWDVEFLKVIYHLLISRDTLLINNDTVSIIDLKIFDLDCFEGVKEVTIKTLSPILIYSTKDNYSTYYDLTDSQATHFILQNIRNKSMAYGKSINHIQFEIVKVVYQKKRMVKFKNCIYPSYLGEMKIRTNYETLQFIYNCGLSSKNSCGFGMIEVLNEN